MLKLKLVLLLLASLVLISSVFGSTSTISNIIQGQTQVLPSKPVIIGGGPIGLPKEASAGTPFNLTLDAINPNDYIVSGTLFLNFTKTGAADAAIVESDITITSSYAYRIYKGDSSATNSVLVHIIPYSAEAFMMVSGVNDALITLSVQFNTPGNYTWSMWISA